MKSSIKAWIAQNQGTFNDIADALWENPELSLKEYQSSARLIEVLKSNGFAVSAQVADMPTAFVATYGSGAPVIGFNAEYDALPGLSQQAGACVKAPLDGDGVGQGCGHNLLGTGAVMGAIALRYAMEENTLQGTIKVFGCPAEELCIGKPFLARAGYFDDVDCFLDWHPWSYNRADYDTCNAYFNIKFHFSGKTAHGNSPWNGKSALDGAVLMGHAIEMLREHYPSAPADAANTLNYTFSDTGPAFPSVVPDHATLWCIGRFQTSELVTDILSRLEDCARGCALATGTTYQSELITATHEKIPNKALSYAVHENLRKCGLPKYSDKEEQLIEDMQREVGLADTGMDKTIKDFGTSGTALCDTSEFSWHAPYSTFWLAMAPSDGWHNWMVTSCAGSSIGKRAMRKAAEVLACSGLDVLQNPALLEAARSEWQERMRGRAYHTLLPDNAKPHF